MVRKKQMNKSKLLLSLFAATAIYSLPLTGLLSVAGLSTGLAFAAEKGDAVKSKRASKKVPAMRNRVYTQLARAQQLADNGDKAAGFAVLDDVKERIEQLNGYEQAMLWNFYGFMHYGNDDIDNAIASFKQVIAQETIPDTLYLSTVYSLAQLAMQQQDYSQALAFLQQWQDSNVKVLDANQHIMFAQVYYQDKQYQQSLTHINQAVAIANQAQEAPKENWLILQRAAYYELKQPENVTHVMEALVKHYPKSQYWLQLAGMYGEIGQEKKQLGAMEAAWLAGYVTKPSDIVMLAQLYLFNQLPYKAAKVLDDAIAKGTVVAEEKHLALLAQAYISAKEDEKALPILAKASEIAEDGKYDAQLAQAYLNLDNWQLAIEYAEKALDRGTENAGTMHLVQGMSYFNLQEFDQAILALTHSQESGSTKKVASQWLVYVKKEKGHQMRLAMNN